MVNVRLDLSANGRSVRGLHDLSRKQRLEVVDHVINDVGDGAYTRLVREIAAYTGMQQKRVRAVMAKRRSYSGANRYEIKAVDEFTSLKDFKPAQRKKGVSAAPWGTRRVFPSTFIGPGGHVFARTSDQPTPIRKLWGPAVPRELVSERSIALFNAVADDIVPRRLAYWNDKALGQVKDRYKL